MEQYRIGDVLITFDGGGYDLLPGTYCSRFRYAGDWTGDRLELRGCIEPLADYARCIKLADGGVYSLHHTEDEPVLLYSWGGCRHGYAVWPDRLEVGSNLVCSFDPAILERRHMSDDWFIGICGLHKGLLKLGRPILHASYIEYENSAILFLGPSGTGKSTQAGLWQDHAKARIINGDRVLLGGREGIWHAYGYPCCGSSNICIDRTVPVKAIVILSQSSENRVHSLSVAQKVRSLVAGLDVYPWDHREIDLAFSLAQEIVTAVPVVGLACRPDEDAVNTLKRYLEDM